MTTEIHMYRPQVAQRSLALLEEVFESGWIGLGPMTEQFEEALANPELVGKHPVAVNSGTAALHLALMVANVPHGSTVIVPANTFISTAAVVLQHQCRVALADIEPTTGNIDLESVRHILEIESGVRAIIPVHYAGIPCDIEGLSELAAEHHLVIIEDCAHAVGARWRDHTMSESPHIQAYSFHATKAIAIGEGGCVTFPDPESAKRAKRLRRLGIDMSTRSWNTPYDIPEIGCKYNMGDVAAAIGLAQLETLPENQRQRQAILGRYRDNFMHTGVTQVAEARAGDLSAGFAVPIRVQSRETLRKNLHVAGIETEIYFRSLSDFPIGSTRPVPRARRFAEEVLCLPIHPGLTLTDVDYISEQVCKNLE
ncbi:DegT/DnrJ/EryC1/StrS family aminotransferase [Rhodococcus sp. HS-D2]|uniref:DegT/DnrJ/EryC1/StrS family aminotransferase n=1 Tax=Rhodococcus sp. HS-D2 TaxID=1384636 RepID=UPI0009EE8E5C|nr:DegT/DnrJ/EryC1/StrS family aminotransferase [Rhodococcus sp. HS-D2]